MTTTWKRLVLCAVLAVATLAWTQPASAETYKRKLAWSGYTWKVRLAKREIPGNNTWGDSSTNVRVLRDGTLRMAISTGRPW